MTDIQVKVGGNLAKALLDIANKVDKAKAVKVGFMENANYADGTKVAMVAAINNFGAPAASIPPRPFFTNMVKENSPEWGSALGDILRQVKFDSNRALGLIGGRIEGQLRLVIRGTNAPPLSPITVMLRGMKSKMGPNDVVTGKTVGEAAKRVAAGLTNYGASTKVLNETGHMLQSVESVVISGDE